MINVAIIEDNKEIGEGLKCLIEGMSGFTCKYLFTTGEDALRYIPENPVDVILMDIHLPGMNGIECTRALKKKCPHSQIIMSTVYEDEDMIFDSLKAGATGYLLKKIEPLKILESIREVYEGGSPMSIQIARKVISSFQQSAAVSESDVLSFKEKTILNLLAEGLRYKEIASKQGISIETVRCHARKIYEKLHVQGRMEAVNKVFPRR